MIMAKEKVNYQEMYDLYQLCSNTKDFGDCRIMKAITTSYELVASPSVEREAW